MEIKFNNLKERLDYLVKNDYYSKEIINMYDEYAQEKLAELSKLSPRYITDVERGLHCPTIPKIESIANSLNIEPYQLFINTDRDAEIIDKMNKGRQYNQK